MDFIPVIDLKEGQVVQAIAGQRDHYQPIRSQLFSGANPFTALEAILSQGFFSTVYIADLDRLMGVGSHQALIQALISRFPTVRFWVDAGGPDAVQPEGSSNLTPVIGTESLVDGRLPEGFGPSDDWILSLDFIRGQPMGSAEIISQPQRWPKNVIVMSLDAVGRGLGPDLDLFDCMQQVNTRSRYFLAGGVRNRLDVLQARAAGAAGILLASALHKGDLTAETLSEFSA